MDIHTFIKKKPYLVWHTKNLEHLSNESIVENVLNYGNFADVQKIISILGIKKVADIFKTQIKKKRNNYRPEIKNYFKLYNEFNEKIFRSQLVYFKDIDYTEKVIFMKGFEVSDKIIKEKLLEFAIS